MEDGTKGEANVVTDINAGETGQRMTDRGSLPAPAQVAAWIGEENYRRWEAVIRLIEENYPGVFTPEWLFGGKKHGWSLRYKKSKSFCTLVPERNRFAFQIVFGAAERTKVEAMLDGLATHAGEDYKNATTYHDGKWLLLTIDSDEVLDDVKLLLAAKRRPAIK